MIQSAKQAVADPTASPSSDKTLNGHVPVAVTEDGAEDYYYARKAWQQGTFWMQRWGSRVEVTKRELSEGGHYRAWNSGGSPWPGDSEV